MSVKKGMLYCCERCQIYWTCERKWYRGEKHQEDICCSICNFYNECLDKLDKKDRERMIKFNENLKD